MSDQILDKYDIAISYLSRDEELAYAIYTELGQVFKIFIYTQHQKELAGGDGIELLRDIFIEKTNLVVILYRDGWGKSDWTNTEEKAIQEFGLNNHWEGILLIDLDKSKKPKWFPGTLFSLDFPKYGFQELIGAMKLRAQERGSEIREATPVEKAKIAETKASTRAERESFLSSEDAANAARQEVDNLFKKIDEISDLVKRETSLTFQNSIEYGGYYSLKGYNNTNIDIGSFGCKIDIIWNQHYANSLRGSTLKLVKFDLGKSIDRNEPYITEEVDYHFDLTPSLSYCWRDINSNKIIKTTKLAEEIVNRMIEFLSSEIHE